MQTVPLAEVYPVEVGILAPELKSVETLFAGTTSFSVPRYQRNFAWTADETAELWEDLSGAVDRSGEYFFGSIVLQRTGIDKLEIIDGQQRLACITMLFSAIRNVFLAAKDERAQQIQLTFLGAKNFERGAQIAPKLALNKTNNETFVQYVLESQDSANIELLLKKKDLHPSNRLLLEAYNFFLSKITQQAALKGTQADAFLVPLLDTIRKKLMLITIPVATDEDANLFFESLNARGKELAISDLVKNRLYLETGDKVDRAEQLWDKMEKDLGRRPVPEFIRHYWIAKKTENDSPTVREKHLYRLIAKDIKGSQNLALALATDFGDTAPDYARISDFTLWPDEPAYADSFEQSLSDLRLFRLTQMNPLLLNAIQHFSSSTEIAKTFRIVANFAFRYFIIGNQSPGNLERVSANIAYGIRIGTFNSPSNVADALRGLNSDINFRSDFTRAKLDGKRIARYALSKITNYLAQQSSQVGVEQIANPDARQVNLEHVLPQDLPAGWSSSFSMGINPADYVHRIGNLTLLTSKINRNMADKSFTDKKSFLDASTLKINESFKGVSQWGDKEIEQRQDWLAKYAVEVWKL